MALALVPADWYHASMAVRKRQLPNGWYPGNAKAIRQMLDQWRTELDQTKIGRKAPAVVGPHAGWYFSGRLSLLAALSLDPELDTVVVAGGHLSANSTILLAEEEEYEVPQTRLPADLDLLEAVKRKMDVAADTMVDNTVEVQLPLLAQLYPHAKFLALRAPASMESFILGQTLAALAGQLDRKLAVFGSTDLTHYGPAYGFTPQGVGETAYEWVKNINDRGIIDAMIAMDPKSCLEAAQSHRAACSVGAVLCAMAFAQANGATNGNLLGYYSSRDIHPSDSFVGYAAVSFPVIAGKFR